MRVNDILQTAEGIAARERLYELFKGGMVKKPFAQWPQTDKKTAETVSRQFELVGLLIEGRRSTRIIFCVAGTARSGSVWLPVKRWWRTVASDKKPPGLWSHFQELDALAKTCRPSIAKMLGYEPAQGVATENESTYPNHGEDVEVVRRLVFTPGLRVHASMR